MGKGLTFGSKRDRVQIIAEMLYCCRVPQTRTSIRQHTNLSYVVLQKCIMHLLMRQWIELTGEESGQQKLIITEKGKAFLDKWLELQHMTGIKSKYKFKPSKGAPPIKLHEFND